MQIMARMNGQTRNIFVHAESGTVSAYNVAIAIYIKLQFLYFFRI